MNPKEISRVNRKWQVSVSVNIVSLPVGTAPRETTGTFVDKDSGGDRPL